MEQKKNKKIYSLILEAKETIFLSIQLAYSLDEAYVQAKLEFIRTNPPSLDNSQINGSKIWLFSSKTVEELNKETEEASILHTEITKKLDILKKMDISNPLSPQQITKNPEIKQPTIEVPKNLNHEKNILMKAIIKNKDILSLKKNEKNFTDNELLYMLNKIGESSDNSPLDK